MVEQVELGARLEGGGRHVVRGQVFQELLPRADRHGDELVRLVGGVLRVDDLGQQEVSEVAVLLKYAPLGQRRPKHRDGLRAGDCHRVLASVGERSDHNEHVLELALQIGDEWPSVGFLE